MIRRVAGLNQLAPILCAGAGQSQLVESGVTGELVPYPDHEKMADAIQRFLDDPAYARRMGDAVRVRTLEMMDPEANDRMQVDAVVYLRRVKVPAAERKPGHVTQAKGVQSVFEEWHEKNGHVPVFDESSPSLKLRLRALTAPNPDDASAA